MKADTDKAVSIAVYEMAHGKILIHPASSRMNDDYMYSGYEEYAELSNEGDENYQRYYE
jgi:hypothetical protein